MMKKETLFKNKRVLIVGLARSGFACAQLLSKASVKVRVSDNQRNLMIEEHALTLTRMGIEIEIGSHTKDFCQQADIVVVSPGVSNTAWPIVWAQEKNIPIISEIEVGWLFCPCPIIAITGSTGKTTTTTLIGKVLAEAGFSVIVCGNIGTPFCQEVTRATQDSIVVLEVSSFQLEYIDKFCPHIAVLTNISRNHLDRYASMEEYVAAKKRIFMNQKAGDFALLNAKDNYTNEMLKDIRAKIRLFTSGNGLNMNEAAVMEVCRIMGISEEVALKVFKTFGGIEHRMEEVATIKGVRFINDSKATTAESCLWALENILSPVLLICGGRDKGVDYKMVASKANNKVKTAFLIGEAREKIAKAFAGKIPFCECSSLEEAVEQAFNKANPGDVILLSPMCSSFDMFLDYEHRGKAFKKIVFKLKDRLGQFV
ncbi:MAG: UDP-N-acetylmuramoyl-L-alanine--D-glutamate ligase [Candidatus Omnitrophica bacterium]|nr:UDP-N-acetylmuramoyl-L-alanine--D-glutamate ligase [Candidatus Omnitrophota bacterium]